jgi:hypothetical protein
MRQVAWFLALSILVSTGCSIRATTDQILDTTSNVTGTTSSSVRGWFDEDGLLKPDFKPIAFVAFNHANVSHDLAAGSGEYLTSMSALLDVPDDRHTAFFSAAQARYAETIGSAPGTPAALLALLQETARPFVPAPQSDPRMPQP